MRGRAFYDAVSGLLGTFLPPELRGYSSYFTGHNIKVWYQDGREHYEVQIVSPRVVKGADGPMLEIGFHSEHKQVERNDEVLERLQGQEKVWRRTLGSEPEVGAFLGSQRTWRRISELWPATETEEDAVAVEAAMRLADYIQAIEPLRS